MYVESCLRDVLFAVDKEKVLPMVPQSVYQTVHQPAHHAAHQTVPRAVRGQVQVP